jgi:hypothetical protein
MFNNERLDLPENMSGNYEDNGQLNFEAEIVDDSAEAPQKKVEDFTVTEIEALSRKEIQKLNREQAISLIKKLWNDIDGLDNSGQEKSSKRVLLRLKLHEIMQAKGLRHSDVF